MRCLMACIIIRIKGPSFRVHPPAPSPPTPTRRQHPRRNPRTQETCAPYLPPPPRLTKDGAGIGRGGRITRTIPYSTGEARMLYGQPDRLPQTASAALGPTL